MGFDPNNYDIVDDVSNTAADYENAVKNTKGGTVSQIIRKKSGTNHDFEFVNADKNLVGLGNVDNTSDEDKPVSIATSDALSDKVDKVTGKELSDNNYSDTEKNSVASNTSHRETVTGNPHAVNKSDVGLGNVANQDTTTTANIADSNDKRFATEAEKTKISKSTISDDQTVVNELAKTQAQYDALGAGRPATTIYFITDAV